MAVYAAALVMLALVFAQVIRSRDLASMRDRTITNCHKIELVKAFIIETVNDSHGLTEAQKTVARHRFAPKPC